MTEHPCLNCDDKIWIGEFCCEECELEYCRRFYEKYKYLTIKKNEKDMFPEETGIPQIKNIIKRIGEVGAGLEFKVRYEICPCGLGMCDELEEPIEEILKLCSKLGKEIDNV